MEFGEKLRQIRKAKGLTQAQLAKKAGLSNGAVGNFESGRRKNLTLESACRLADALGVEPEELGLRRRYDLEEKLQKAMEETILQKEERRNEKLLDELVKAFYGLNDEGKLEAVKRVSELSELSRYRW